MCIEITTHVNTNTLTQHTTSYQPNGSKTPTLYGSKIKTLGLG